MKQLFIISGTNWYRCWQTDKHVSYHRMDGVRTTQWRKSCTRVIHGLLVALQYFSIVCKRDLYVSLPRDVLGHFLEQVYGGQFINFFFFNFCIFFFTFFYFMKLTSPWILRKGKRKQRAWLYYRIVGIWYPYRDIAFLKKYLRPSKCLYIYW